MENKRVVIVGGGFAGMNCARLLVKNPALHVTLIDKNNYNQFTPLLYQIATSALSLEEMAISFRHYFKGKSNIDIKMAQVRSVDPHTQTVETVEGPSYRGDFLVLAAGAVPNFFDLPGAEEYAFPLYNLLDAERLRSRILAVFEDADRDPALVDRGALNFVIVGGGATGSEVAGALSDMLRIALPKEFQDLSLNKSCIYVVDHAPSLLAAFSKKSQEYAEAVLRGRGVVLKLGLLVKEVAPDHVVLSNGEKILTRTVIWAGGLKANPLAGNCGAPQGHGGRIQTQADLTVAGFPTLYAIGDMGSALDEKGKMLPQLASVAKQSGEWAARNIEAQAAGRQPLPFRYEDKGIMAMIGRNAAVAEVGRKRKTVKGILAYLGWLGVHALLLPTFRQRVQALFDWAWGYFSRMPTLQILDRREAECIDWHEENQ